MIQLSELKSTLEDNFQGCYTFPKLEDEAKKSTSNITCICPLHGEFKKRLSYLTNDKMGCPHCADLRRVIAMKSDVDNALKEMIAFYKYVMNPVYTDMLIVSTSRNAFQNYPRLANNSYQLLKFVYFRYRLISGHGAFSL